LYEVHRFCFVIYGSDALYDILLFIQQLALLVHFFFCTDTATTEIYTLSLHDALPISLTHAERSGYLHKAADAVKESAEALADSRSEEHTSELQSRFDLVCRLLLEKKKRSTEGRIS